MFGGFEELGSDNTDTDSEGYIKIEEEDYDPNNSNNIIDYDKYYNKTNQNISDDSFIITNEKDLKCTTEEEEEIISSFNTELETESDQELKEYLDKTLYD